MKKLLLLFGFILCFFNHLEAQKTTKSDIENADFSDINQDELPDAVLLRGNVRVRHEGVVMTCNKAYFFQK